MSARLWIARSSWPLLAATLGTTLPDSVTNSPAAVAVATAGWLRADGLGNRPDHPTDTGAGSRPGTRSRTVGTSVGAWRRSNSCPIPAVPQHQRRVRPALHDSCRPVGFHRVPGDQDVHRLGGTVAKGHIVVHFSGDSHDLGQPGKAMAEAEASPRDSFRRRFSAARVVARRDKRAVAACARRGPARGGRATARTARSQPPRGTGNHEPQGAGAGPGAERAGRPQVGPVSSLGIEQRVFVGEAPRAASRNSGRPVAAWSSSRATAYPAEPWARPVRNSEPSALPRERSGQTNAGPRRSAIRQSTHRGRPRPRGSSGRRGSTQYQQCGDCPGVATDHIRLGCRPGFGRRLWPPGRARSDPVKALRVGQLRDAAGCVRPAESPG